MEVGDIIHPHMPRLLFPEGKDVIFIIIRDNPEPINYAIKMFEVKKGDFFFISNSYSLPNDDYNSYFQIVGQGVSAWVLKFELYQNFYVVKQKEKKK